MVIYALATTGCNPARSFDTHCSFKIYWPKLELVGVYYGHDRGIVKWCGRLAQIIETNFKSFDMEKCSLKEQAERIFAFVSTDSVFNCGKDLLPVAHGTIPSVSASKLFLHRSQDIEPMVEFVVVRST